jgi:hypothetical protein
MTGRLTHFNAQFVTPHKSPRMPFTGSRRHCLFSSSLEGLPITDVAELTRIIHFPFLKLCISTQVYIFDCCICYTGLYAVVDAQVRLPVPNIIQDNVELPWGLLVLSAYHTCLRSVGKEDCRR